MLEHDVDGVILVPAAGTSAESLRKIIRYCPLVLVTRYVPELAVDYVGIDNEAGACSAMELLIELGHQRIAFIGGLDDSSAWRDRLRGYQTTLEKHHIPFDPDLCRPSLCIASRRLRCDSVRSRRGQSPVSRHLLQ